MPRGKKSYTLEEQLELTIKEIDSTKAALKELEQKKQDLTEKIKQQHLAELDALIKESGLSLDEVKEMLIKK